MAKVYTSSGYINGDTILHYGVLIDATKPTTGVVSNHSIEFLSEVMFESGSIDLNWEEHIKECQGLCSHCRCEHESGKCDCSTLEHEYDPTGEHDNCGPRETGTVLIGGWKKDSDGKLEANRESEYSAIVGETETQVVWSRHTTRASLCSPCFPGQADLNTPGDVLAYCLPPEMMGP